MADNTITKRALTPDPTVFVAHPNDYFTALSGLIVPRIDSAGSGVPTDIAGDIGSTVYRWANAYIKKLFIGTPANGIAVADNAGKLSLEVAGSEELRFASTHRSVTEDGSDPGEGGICFSSDVDFSTSSTSYVDVTNASVTLTITGRPVEISFISDTSNTGYIRHNNSSEVGFNSYLSNFKLVRDSTDVAEVAMGHKGQSVSVGEGKFPPATVRFLDHGNAAGTYTWKIQTKVNRAAMTSQMRCRMMVREII